MCGKKYKLKVNVKMRICGYCVFLVIAKIQNKSVFGHSIETINCVEENAIATTLRGPICI